MARTLIALVAAVGLIMAGGCGTAPENDPPEAQGAPAQDVATSSANPQPPPPESVSANELGVVPILMYHRITTEPTSVYDRTPREFRAELQRLAREDYVPVTTAEYATGRIDIPPGTHPVVLTFDDASASQFSLNARGRPKEGTAVDILLDVAERFPQFRPVASFYITTPPFGEPGNERALRWLHEHGFELGNHTLTHANLGQQPPDEVQHQIAAMQRRITSAVPDARVSTLALPHGVAPDNGKLALTGSSSGVRYRHDAVLLVGASPAPSPFSREFDPLQVPRIRSQGSSGKGHRFGSTAWLDKLAAHPGRRYTSDGNPKTVSFPSDGDERIARDFAARANPY